MIDNDIFKISRIDVQTNKIFFICNNTKKGYSDYADNLKKSDLFNQFSQKDQVSISFNAGIIYKNNTQISKNNITRDFISNNYLYVFLISIYAIVFFGSSITGTTLIHFRLLNSSLNIIAPAAIFIYAFSFVLDAIITEVYNISIARRTYTIVGISTISLIIFIYILSFLPTLGENNLKNLFSRDNNVFIIALASLFSFFISQYINSTIISKVKNQRYKNKGKIEASCKQEIILRFIIASLFSTFIDSVLFCSLAFGYRVSLNTLSTIIISQYFIKVCFDIFTCYISSSLAMKIKNIEKTDILEDDNISLSKIIALNMKYQERKNVYTKD